MAKRVRLCPEITDPSLRSFLDIVPAIRKYNTEVIMEQKRAGENQTIALEGREISICVHRAEGEMRPVLFEFHGGGFILGNAEKDDALCEEISKRLNCCVIGVNYRLTPEEQYPSAVNDAYDVVCYIKEHAGEYGIDPKKMAVMGCSSGATLAAVTAMRCAKEGDFNLSAQILHYPYLDAVHMPEEKEHYTCDMDEAVMRAFTILYSKEEERALPYVSPVCAEKEALKAVAPACILTAEKDSLKQEGLRYAENLKAAGVPVYCQVMPDVHHGYIEDAYNPEVYEMTAEDTRALHSPYFREWAKAAIGISADFLEEQWKEQD